MTTDRRRRRRFKEAYAEAWAECQRTGDGSDDVLLEALRRHKVSDLPGEDEASELILGIWRRGTLPRDVPAEATKVGLWLAGPVEAAFAELDGRFDGARRIPLTDLPGGRQRVSAGLDWEMHSLPVVYDKVPTSYLGLLDLPVANTNTGELALQAWLLAHPEPALADVMVGEVSIGSVRVSEATWAQLRALEDENRFADGVVFCWPLADGVVEPDSLRCVLPR